MFQAAFALVVVAAVAFCADNPSADLCAARAPVAVEASAADLDRLERLALRAYIRAKTPRRIIRAHDGNGRADDAWRVGSPTDRSDDCEDRVLWLAETLRTEAPALYAAFRPVLIVESRRDGVVRAHLVGVIGDAVIDPRFRDAQPWSRYARSEAYTPERGIGGRWIRYREIVLRP